MRKNIKVNELPSPTWRWLKLNESWIEDMEPLIEKEASYYLPKDVEISKTPRNSISNIETALGKDMEMVIDDAIDNAKTMVVNNKVMGPLRIDIDYLSDDRAANSFMIEAKDNSEVYIIMKFTGGSGKGTGAVQTKYKIGKNAKVTLVQVQALGNEFRFLNDIGGECEENGEFKLIQLVLGGKESYIGNRTELIGDGSNLETKIAYRTRKDQLLDMNYISNHHGKKTLCDIKANGVMKDSSHKIFRGTIDFKRGCSGSLGNENEDILLLNKDVINRTIPVILCTEEDVEGNHGASIGKLDENEMFYLTSRGISEADVLKMMARARIDGIKNLIEDEMTVQYVDLYLNDTGAN